VQAIAGGRSTSFLKEYTNVNGDIELDAERSSRARGRISARPGRSRTNDSRSLPRNRGFCDDRERSRSRSRSRSPVRAPVRGEEPSGASLPLIIVYTMFWYKASCLQTQLMCAYCLHEGSPGSCQCVAFMHAFLIRSPASWPLFWANSS
jgi:hypothetical protein